MLALAIIGQMRTYRNEQIINSYKKYLCKDSSIDLYIFTWNKLGCSNRHGYTNIHNKMNDLVSTNDILDYYKKYDFINVKHIFVEDFDNFVNGLDADILKIYNTPFLNHSKVSTYVPVQYKYQQAVRYLSNLEDINKYSNLIITRPDICFVDELPILDTKIDNIYWNCICIQCMDHCWYGKPQTIIKQLFNIFDNIMVNYNEITSGNQHNRENNKILHWECEKNNIKVNVDKKHMVRIIYF